MYNLFIIYIIYLQIISDVIFFKCKFLLLVDKNAIDLFMLNLQLAIKVNTFNLTTLPDGIFWILYEHNNVIWK